MSKSHNKISKRLPLPSGPARSQGNGHAPRPLTKRLSKVSVAPAWLAQARTFLNKWRSELSAAEQQTLYAPARAYDEARDAQTMAAEAGDARALANAQRSVQRALNDARADVSALLSDLAASASKSADLKAAAQALQKALGETQKRDQVVTAHRFFNEQELREKGQQVVDDLLRPLRSAVERAGGNFDRDVLGVYHDLNRKRVSVDLGDWASPATVQTLRRYLGVDNYDFEVGGPPTAGKWLKIWPDKQRKMQKESAPMSNGNGGTATATVTTDSGLSPHDLEGQTGNPNPRTVGGALTEADLIRIAAAMQGNWHGDLSFLNKDAVTESDKYEACVLKVKEENKKEGAKKVNPWAVCYAALSGDEKAASAGLRKGEDTDVLPEWHGFYKFIGKSEEERIVIGIGTSEAIDGQDEIVDSGAIRNALEDFMKWANLREMHDNRAAGVVLKAEPLDGEVEVSPGVKVLNPLRVEAKVVDDQAWLKVKTGVYKGFSIGGKVLNWVMEKLLDGKWVRRITELLLTEISLVDRPANQDARIILWKRDEIQTAELPTAKVGKAEKRHMTWETCIAHAEENKADDPQALCAYIGRRSNLKNQVRGKAEGVKALAPDEYKVGDDIPLDDNVDIDQLILEAAAEMKAAWQSKQSADAKQKSPTPEKKVGDETVIDSGSNKISSASLRKEQDEKEVVRRTSGYLYRNGNLTVQQFQQKFGFDPRKYTGLFRVGTGNIVTTTLRFRTMLEALDNQTSGNFGALGVTNRATRAQFQKAKPNLDYQPQTDREKRYIGFIQRGTWDQESAEERLTLSSDFLAREEKAGRGEGAPAKDARETVEACRAILRGVYGVNKFLRVPFRKVSSRNTVRLRLLRLSKQGQTFEAEGDEVTLNSTEAFYKFADEYPFVNDPNFKEVVQTLINSDAAGNTGEGEPLSMTLKRLAGDRAEARFSAQEGGKRVGLPITLSLVVMPEEKEKPKPEEESVPAEAETGKMAKAVRAASLRKHIDKYVAMPQQQFVELHKDKFVRYKGKRNIVGITSDDGMVQWQLPPNSQRNGRLTKQPEEILKEIHRNLVTHWVDMVIGAVNPYAPPAEKNAEMPPAEVLKDYPDLEQKVNSVNAGKAARAWLRKQAPNLNYQPQTDREARYLKFIQRGTWDQESVESKIDTSRDFISSQEKAGLPDKESTQDAREALAACVAILRGVYGVRKTSRASLRKGTVGTYTPESVGSRVTFDDLREAKDFVSVQGLSRTWDLNDLFRQWQEAHTNGESLRMMFTRMQAGCQCDLINPQHTVLGTAQIRIAKLAKLMKGVYPPATLVMNAMGNIHAWSGTVDPVKVGKYNWQVDGKDSPVYFQVDTDVRAVMESLTPEEQKDLDGGWTVHTTNFADDYFAAAPAPMRKADQSKFSGHSDDFVDYLKDVAPYATGISQNSFVVELDNGKMWRVALTSRGLNVITYVNGYQQGNANLAITEDDWYFIASSLGIKVDKSARAPMHKALASAWNMARKSNAATRLRKYTIWSPEEARQTLAIAGVDLKDPALAEVLNKIADAARTTESGLRIEVQPLDNKSLRVCVYEGQQEVCAANVRRTEIQRSIMPGISKVSGKGEIASLDALPKGGPYEYANEDEHFWSQAFAVSFADVGGTWFIINADNEQDAVDAAADVAEERGYKGYFLDPEEESEHEGDVTNVGNHGLPIKASELHIQQLPLNRASAKSIFAQLRKAMDARQLAEVIADMQLLRNQAEADGDLDGAYLFTQMIGVLTQFKVKAPAPVKESPEHEASETPKEETAEHMTDAEAPEEEKLTLVAARALLTKIDKGANDDTISSSRPPTMDEMEIINRARAFVAKADAGELPPEEMEEQVLPAPANVTGSQLDDASLLHGLIRALSQFLAEHGDGLAALIVQQYQSGNGGEGVPDPSTAVNEAVDAVDNGMVLASARAGKLRKAAADQGRKALRAIKQVRELMGQVRLLVGQGGLSELTSDDQQALDDATTAISAKLGEMETRLQGIVGAAKVWRPDMRKAEVQAETLVARLDEVISDAQMTILNSVNTLEGKAIEGLDPILEKLHEIVTALREASELMDDLRAGPEEEYEALARTRMHKAEKPSRAFAEELLQYHGGGSSAVYQIGSSMMAGNIDAITPEMVKEAVKELRTPGKHGFTPEEKTEFNQIADRLAAMYNVQASARSRFHKGLITDAEVDQLVQTWQGFNADQVRRVLDTVGKQMTGFTPEDIANESGLDPINDRRLVDKVLDYLIEKGRVTTSDQGNSYALTRKQSPRFHKQDEGIKQVKEGSLKAVEIGNGYALYGTTPEGAEVFLAHMGDGVDMFTTEDGESIPAGTPEFDAALKDSMEDEGELAEAYDFELVKRLRPRFRKVIDRLFEQTFTSLEEANAVEDKAGRTFLGDTYADALKEGGKVELSILNHVAQYGTKPEYDQFYFNLIAFDAQGNQTNEDSAVVTRNVLERMGLKPTAKNQRPRFRKAGKNGTSAPPRRFSLAELIHMPTLATGQIDDLKYEDLEGGWRVWISRGTVEDGEPYENKVSVEHRTPEGKWETLDEEQYEAKALRPHFSKATLDQLKPGMKVSHPRYGRGVVKQLGTIGPTKGKVIVQFSNPVQAVLGSSPDVSASSLTILPDDTEVSSETWDKGRRPRFRKGTPPEGALEWMKKFLTDAARNDEAYGDAVRAVEAEYEQEFNVSVYDSFTDEQIATIAIEQYKKANVDVTFKEAARPRFQKVKDFTKEAQTYGFEPLNAGDPSAFTLGVGGNTNAYFQVNVKGQRLELVLSPDSNDRRPDNTMGLFSNFKEVSEAISDFEDKNPEYFAEGEDLEEAARPRFRKLNLNGLTPGQNVTLSRTEALSLLERFGPDKKTLPPKGRSLLITLPKLYDALLNFNTITLTQIDDQNFLVQTNNTSVGTGAKVSRPRFYKRSLRRRAMRKVALIDVIGAGKRYNELPDKVKAALDSVLSAEPLENVKEADLQAVLEFLQTFKAKPDEDFIFAEDVDQLVQSLSDHLGLTPSPESEGELPPPEHDEATETLEEESAETPEEQATEAEAGTEEHPQPQPEEDEMKPKKAARSPLRKEDPAAQQAEDLWQSPGPGKFEGRGGKLAEKIYDVVMNGFQEEQLGEEGFGAYDLVVTDEYPDYGQAFILHGDSQGFVGVMAYDTEAEARKVWAGLEKEYEEWTSSPDYTGETGEGDEEGYEGSARARFHKGPSPDFTWTPYGKGKDTWHAMGDIADVTYEAVLTPEHYEMGKQTYGIRAWSDQGDEYKSDSPFGGLDYAKQMAMETIQRWAEIQERTGGKTDRKATRARFRKAVDPTIGAAQNMIERSGYTTRAVGNTLLVISGESVATIKRVLGELAAKFTAAMDGANVKLTLGAVAANERAPFRKSISAQGFTRINKTIRPHLRRPVRKEESRATGGGFAHVAEAGTLKPGADYATVTLKTRDELKAFEQKLGRRIALWHPDEAFRLGGRIKVDFGVFINTDTGEIVHEYQATAYDKEGGEIDSEGTEITREQGQRFGNVETAEAKVAPPEAFGMRARAPMTKAKVKHYIRFTGEDDQRKMVYGEFASSRAADTFVANYENAGGFRRFATDDLGETRTPTDADVIPLADSPDSFKTLYAALYPGESVKSYSPSMTKRRTPLRKSHLVDQYGDPVPDDLVTLPSIEGLSEEEIKTVDSANWYEVSGNRHAILASASAINYLSEDALEDSGITLDEDAEINLIDRPLHRSSEEDGFYHASAKAPMTKRRPLRRPVRKGKSYQSENEGKVWVGTRNFDGTMIEPGTLALEVVGNSVVLSGETPEGEKITLDNDAVGYGPYDNETGGNMWLDDHGNVNAGMVSDANNDVGYDESTYMTALRFKLQDKGGSSGEMEYAVRAPMTKRRPTPAPARIVPPPIVAPVQRIEITPLPDLDDAFQVAGLDAQKGVVEAYKVQGYPAAWQTALERAKLYKLDHTQIADLSRTGGSSPSGNGNGDAPESVIKAVQDALMPVAQLSETVEALRERIKQIEDTPIPGGPITRLTPGARVHNLRAVDKRLPSTGNGNGNEDSGSPSSLFDPRVAELRRLANVEPNMRLRAQYIQQLNEVEERLRRMGAS